MANVNPKLSYWLSTISTYFLAPFGLLSVLFLLKSQGASVFFPQPSLFPKPYGEWLFITSSAALFCLVMVLVHIAGVKNLSDRYKVIKESLPLGGHYLQAVAKIMVAAVASLAMTFAFHISIHLPPQAFLAEFLYFFLGAMISSMISASLHPMQKAMDEKDAKIVRLSYLLVFFTSFLAMFLTWCFFSHLQPPPGFNTLLRQFSLHALGTSGLICLVGSVLITGFHITITELAMHHSQEKDVDFYSSFKDLLLQFLRTHALFVGMVLLYVGSLASGYAFFAPNATVSSLSHYMSTYCFSTHAVALYATIYLSVLCVFTFSLAERYPSIQNKSSQVSVESAEKLKTNNTEEQNPFRSKRSLVNKEDDQENSQENGHARQRSLSSGV